MIPKSAIKIDGKHGEVDWAILKKKGVLPLHKTHSNMITPTPLPSFVASFRGLLHEESELPRVHISDGFELNANKLMKKSSYDFSKLPPFGNVIEAKSYGLNDT